MNIPEYIASGILEQYVLGSVTEQERREVECLSKIYPELQSEITALQETMSMYASVYRKDAPPALKQKIFSEIEKLELEKTDILPSVAGSQAVKTFVPSWIKFAAAACALTAITLSVMYTRQQKMLQESEVLLAEKNNQNQLLDSSINLIKADLNLLSDKYTQRIQLSGIPEKYKQGNSRIYWNTESKKVYLDVVDLPTPPSGKQYQLWAIKDGQPVDLGVFNLQQDSEFITMKTIDIAQAFAITLEDIGGVVSPTLEEMYVYGVVSGN